MEQAAPAVAQVDSKKRKADEQEAPAKKAKVESSVEGETNQIWVGQLSWNVDNEWLKSIFDEYGEVTSARVQTDRESGKSRGFGFVEFSTPAAAKKAFEEAQGKEVDGRNIKVDLSTPKPPRDQADSRAKKFNDERSAPSKTLFVGNLSFSLTEDDIWNTFAEYGEVSSVRLPKDPESGLAKGFGYVEYASQEHATKAIDALSGKDLGGRPVRLDFAGARPENGGGGGRGGARGGRGGGRGGQRGGAGGGRGGGRGGSFRGMPAGSGWGAAFVGSVKSLGIST
ncbi:RNA-binding domain-containing protein [Violaceomyces palustris]|uniref:RNA-binding domain-containing protein n=1 Tax=Violaceomyces palustris TaxID=1673888 RepID=A0ACD0P561_9BASI|nr:RNA-binding domain-containing protein [Violaceomyces palustris]